MASKKPQARTNCSVCPLRKNEAFRDFNRGELQFIEGFKTGELTVDKGAVILVEGSHSPHLFTVLSGVAFRYKILEDGRRQILNFALPGDLIGLQGTVIGEMEHSVEALTPMSLCLFERSRLESLFREHPGLAYDLTWIAAREERILDEHLLSIGRRSALERAAYLLAFLYRKFDATDAFANGKPIFPITQQLLSDTLGLSIVHTNKTLRKLADRSLIRWKEKGCEIIDPDGLAAIANWDWETEIDRPFI